MNEHLGSGAAKSHRLPPYRGILAVDTVRFTDNRSADQPGLSAAIPAILEQALRTCGIGEVWETRRFPEGTGDGYVFGAPPEYLPFLVDPLFDQLELILEDQSRQLAARHRDLRLRLRVSLHVGPVPDDEGTHSVGKPINDTFRLLDSMSIREALKRANPDVTHMAAIVSQRVYEDVIRAGYTGLHPDRFDPVTAEVPGKDFAEPAWLYVPRPSRGGDAQELAARTAEPSSSARHAIDSAPHTTVHGNVGQAITAHRVSGEFNPVLHSGFQASRPRSEGEAQ